MPNENARGIVSRTYTKDWYDKRSNENIILHSFQLEGDKTYYRTGTNALPANKGDAIEFSFDSRSGNVDVASVTQTEASEVERAPAAPRRNTGGRTGSYGGGAPRSGGGSVSSGGSRDDYWKDKETRDMAREERYQTVVEPRIALMAAQERAVAVVAAALANDCLSFGNTAKGAKFDLLLGFVDEATEHFVKQAMNASSIVEGMMDERPAKSTVAESEEWNDD